MCRFILYSWADPALGLPRSRYDFLDLCLCGKFQNVETHRRCLSNSSSTALLISYVLFFRPYCELRRRRAQRTFLLTSKLNDTLFCSQNLSVTVFFLNNHSSIIPAVTVFNTNVEFQNLIKTLQVISQSSEVLLLYYRKAHSKLSSLLSAIHQRITITAARLLKV